MLRKAGLTDEQVRILLEDNPQRVLTVKASVVTEKESVGVAKKN
jgi:phosphotriesterase-related protein